MSAIAAFVHRDSLYPATAELDRMIRALAMYGADAPGTGPTHVDGKLVSGAGLASTLSHYLPQDAAEVQPRWSADRSACLVADVRLDARQDLCGLLGLSAAALDWPDSALLMAAWERWRGDCVRHLTGTFAFAVWTPATRELFAARDPTGEAPLFFYKGEDFFALSSMQKGLRALPGVGRDWNESWIAEWLVDALHVERTTLYSGIETLPPGTFLRVREGVVEIQRYWLPTDAKPVRFRADREYAEGLAEVLDRATADRLRRRGGVACHLSSGLDSSSVMASAAMLLGDEPLRAYTAVPQAGFSTASYSRRPVIDEGPMAAEAAACYHNVDYVPFTTAGLRYLPALEEFSDALDEPFLNGVNVLWLAGIPRDARAHGAGVMLQGAAGNGTISFESFGVAAEWLRAGRWGRLLRHMYTLRANGEWSYRNAWREIWPLALPPAVQRMRWRRQGIVYDRAMSLINPEFAREQRLGEKALADRLDRGSGHQADHLEFYRRVDIGRNNAATMALSGLSVRDPTNDRRVWEYCMGIPAEQYAIDGHSRSLVRRAMRGRLPDATLDRYRAGRQGADWYMTIRESLPALLQEVGLIEQCPLACRTLDMPRVRWLVENFPAEGHGTMRVMYLWKYSLARAISLGNFLRRHG